MNGFCPQHEGERPVFVRQRDNRPSPSIRGYGAEWRKVREEVLIRSGIPRAEWHRYDIDHNPPYNPAVEKDHRKYQLIPRLHGEHSRKTVREDGGYGHAKKARP